jgi:hypothetical protein
MTTFRPRLRALVVGAAALALVTIGAGGTLAASTTPTLYACFNANGQVSMATIPQCKLAGGGQLAQINAAGVQGPTGPQGSTGATGDTGPTGPTGPAAATWTRYSILLGSYVDVPMPGDGVEWARLQCLPPPYAPSVRVGYLGRYTPRPHQWREVAFGSVFDLGGLAFDMVAAQKERVTIDDTANGGPIKDWTFILESTGATCEMLVGIS